MNFCLHSFAEYRNYLDHEERLPLFTKAVEWDPELPYAPLLRSVYLCNKLDYIRSLLLYTLVRLIRMMNLHN